tara:strand:- start:518 stop:814 length:297 start_codon:yes stop_codon:yes gene_type:complete
MAKRYTFTTCLSFGTDGEADFCELDVTVSFAFTPGRAAAPPAYDHGGLPADPPEIDDIQVELIDGRPVTASDGETINAILDQFATGDFDDAMMDEVAE